MSVSYSIKGMMFLHRACFAKLQNDVIVAKATKDDTIIYYIESKVTKDVFYKYLLFLRQISLFKSVIKAPKKIVTSDKIEISLNSNALTSFVLFTALRAANEFPRYVEKLVKYYPNNTSFSNLELLGILSVYSKGMTNSNHWFCSGTPDLKINKKVLDESKNNILFYGVKRKLFDLFSYAMSYNTKKANQIIIEHKL